MGLYFCSIDSCKFLRLLSILIKFYKDTYQRTMKFFLFVHTVRVFKTIIKIILKGLGTVAVHKIGSCVVDCLIVAVFMLSFFFSYLLGN